MTEEILKASVKIESNTLEETKKAQSLNKELESINSNTKKIAGSMAAGKAASKSSYVDKGATGTGDREDYRVARAGMGTGAEGRDFAKQAQGLGGLVHVYATFAANIFAVTAAFQLLDKAYSTVRLEKAADIMSTRVGFSVKGLSRDLMEATDHAVSFQEAMQFSNMGIAAGLSGKQITELTVIAKGAANALGRDMGDAVRRMIQGTAKQEQEILDELGIFVKAKTAYADYAKKLGVGVDELSAAQRVQAYADAVAKAGQKWKDFAAIEDPFSAFVSNLKESGTELLNLVNKAFTPLISFLAKTQGLVEAIMVAVIGKLGMIALPHLGTQLRSLFAVDMKEIEKQIAGHRAIIASHRETINELADRRNVTAGSMRSAYGAMNTAGIDFGKDTLIGSFAGKTTNVSELNREEVAKRLTKTIQTGIITETQLEAAKTQNLIYQRSTLDNIIVKKGAIRQLTEDTLKISQQQNANLLQYRAIQEQILNSEAELVALEEGRIGRINPISTANAKLRSESSSRIQGIVGAQDISWMNKGGDPGKLSKIWDELSGTIMKSVGWVGKASAAFMAFGEVASLALKGIMTAMPYVLAAFMAWDLVVKPLLYFFGFWSERQDKIDEATKRLTEDTDTLARSFANLYQNMSTDISGEQLTQNYALRIRSLTTVKNDIEKLLEEASRPSKTDTNYKEANWSGFAPPKELPFTAGFKGDFTTGAGKKSEQLLSLEKLTGSASDVDMQTEGWKKLYQIKNDLFDLEVKRIKDPGYLNYEADAKIKLLETRDAITEVIAKEELRATHLAGMLDPMRQASKTVQDYIDKGKESSDETIKQLGIVEPILQQVYKERGTALRKLMSEQNDVNKQATINTFVTTMVDDYNAMGMATDGAAVRLKYLYQIATGSDQVAAKEAQKLLTKETETYLLAVQKRFAEDKRRASQRNADNLLFAQEQQLRNLEIEGQKMLLKGKEQQMSVEEKLNGYRNQGHLASARELELQIVGNEYAKNIFEINKKAKDNAKDPKALEIQTKSIANAKLLVQYNIDLTNEKYKQLERDRLAAEYQRTTGELIKQNIERTASVHKVANIQGLTSESDNLKIESRSKILDLDLQIEEMDRKRIGYINDGIDAENLRTLNLQQQTLVMRTQNIERETAAQLAKIDRTKAISDTQKELTYQQLLHTEAMDKSNMEFKGAKDLAILRQITALQEKKTRAEVTQLYYTEMDAEERNIALETLKIQKIKEGEEVFKQSIASRQKSFSVTEVAASMQLMADMAMQESERFNKSITPVIKRVFEGIYAGMDAAIDSYLTKVQTGQKRTWHEFRDQMKNVLSDQFKAAAADQLKSVGRASISGLANMANIGLGGVFNPKQTGEDKIVASIEAAKAQEQVNFDIRSRDYASQTSILDEQLMTLRLIEAHTSTNILGAGVSTPLGPFNSQGIGIGTNMSSMLSGINTSEPFYNSPSGYGVSSSQNNFAAGLAGGLAGGVGSMSANLIAGILTKHENGGIMTQYGPMRLNKYASGGIATSPQVALFGEGRQNEAYVPLPDGNSIPVTMNNKGAKSTGDTITIQVNINTSTGTTSTSTAGADSNKADAYTQFAASVSQLVTQELITQKRPGGLLAA